MVGQSPPVDLPVFVFVCVFLSVFFLSILWWLFTCCDIWPGSTSALEPPHLRLIRCPASSNRPPSWAELLNGVVGRQSALEYCTKPGSSPSIVSWRMCTPARRETYCLLCLFPLGTEEECIFWRWITSTGVFLERGQKRTTTHYRGTRRRALWIACMLKC